MTTHPDDRTDDRDDTITVTSLDSDGHPVSHTEPVDVDGQPIFPPEPGETARSSVAGDGTPVAAYADPRDGDDTRADDTGLLGDPGGATRLLPDSTGHTSPLDDRVQSSSADGAGFSVPPDEAASRSRDAGYPAAGSVADVDRSTGYSSVDISPADDSSSSAPGTPIAAPTDIAAPDDIPPPADLPPADPIVPVAEPAHRATAADEAWVTLQGAFVDDPAQAVRDAGDRVEEQLAAFRGRLDSADTEQLRTAFKQFRELSQILR